MSENSPQPVYRDALPIGTILNGYTIRSVLGRGGFGVTYLAIDQLDQSFAIKEYFPKQFATRQGLDVIATSSLEQEPFNDCRERFLAEAKTLCQLGRALDDHSIVKVFTFFEAHGTAYIVMEYLSGETLEDVLARFPKGLPPEELGDILRSMLAALQRVHEVGIVHRDIKPANIFINSDGRPVLIDFGSARVESSGRNTTYTQIFSGGYAPMEQMAGLRQGPFSDIYAIGAVCYRAMGGRIVEPFTRHQAMLRQKPDPMVPAKELGAGRYPDELLEAIDRALAVVAEDRPQSAAELLDLIGAPTEERTTKLRMPRGLVEHAAPEESPAIKPDPATGQPSGTASAAHAVTLIGLSGNRRPSANARPADADLVAATPGRKSHRAILLAACATAAATVLIFVGFSVLGESEADAWAAANANPSENAYEKYLKHYPASPHRADAEASLAGIRHKAAIDQAAAEWGRVRDTNSAADVDAFIQTHPQDAPVMGEARARLAQLRGAEADSAWVSVNNSDDPAVLANYIATYPTGKHIADAKARLETVSWERVKNSSDPDILDRYINDYPNSAHLADARERRDIARRRQDIIARNHAEADAWQEARDVGSVESLRAFLANYPDGPHAPEARQALATLGNPGDGPHTAQQDRALQKWIDSGHNNNTIVVVPVGPHY